MPEIKTRIILRNDSTENWLQNLDAVLLAGEPGLERLPDGSTRLKLGDGATPWSELPYLDNPALISSVDSEFVITDGKLSIDHIASSKIVGLEEALNSKITKEEVDTLLADKVSNDSLAALLANKVDNSVLAESLANKVDKVEGARLITEGEIEKLEKLIIEEDGSVSISGNVAAGNVDGLTDWIANRADTLKGLSENNFSDTLLQKLEGVQEGAQVNVIDGVSEEFIISPDSKVLRINAIGLDKVTGLSVALQSKVDAVEGMGLSHNDLTDELVAKINSYTDPLIKSVSADFSVSDDGMLSLHQVSVSSLTQGDDEWLVLQGGGANVPN